LTEEEEAALSSLALVLDDTNIAKGPDIEKFRFELRKNQTSLLYKSRYTVMDRPCWKNESCPFKLGSKGDTFQIAVYRVKKPKDSPSKEV